MPLKIRIEMKVRRSNFIYGFLYNRCVLPNKMFIQLAEDVNPRETCALRPQGVIRICAVEARNLLKKDVNDEKFIMHNA